jgi:hypothetical protein
MTNKVRPTPERVARMLASERARLVRLESEAAETRARIAALETTAARLEAGEQFPGR